MLVINIIYFNVDCSLIFAESKIKERFKIKITETSNIQFRKQCTVNTQT